MTNAPEPVRPGTPAGEAGPAPSAGAASPAAPEGHGPEGHAPESQAIGAGGCLRDLGIAILIMLAVAAAVLYGIYRQQPEEFAKLVAAVRGLSGPGEAGRPTEPTDETPLETAAPEAMPVEPRAARPVAGQADPEKPADPPARPAPAAPVETEKPAPAGPPPRPAPAATAEAPKSAARLAYEAHLERARSRIRSGGHPSTLSELNAYYREPAGPGLPPKLAALLARADWTVAAKGPKNEPPAAAEYLRFGDFAVGAPGDLDEAASKLLAEHIERNRGALDALRLAAGVTSFRHEVDFTRATPRDGFEPGLGHLAGIREGTRLLCLEAVALAEEGKDDEAARCVTAAARLARSVSAEPVLISQMVGIGAEEEAARALQRVLSRGGVSDIQLFALSVVFSDTPAEDRVFRALAGERCMGVEVFAHPFEFLAPEEKEAAAVRADLERSMAGGSLVADIDFFVTATGASMAAARQRPRRKALETARHLEARKSATITRGKAKVLSGVILPAVKGPIEADARAVALARCTRVALAIERFRLVTGIPPYKLGTLVPDPLKAVPEDPFDGRPLRFRRSKSGYAVYSVGPDGKDNGGAAADDVVFEVWRVIRPEEVAGP